MDNTNLNNYIKEYARTYSKNLAFLTKLNSPVPNKDRKRISAGELESLSKDTFYRVSNADEILKLFPELEIATQIVVSSIVSSNDLIKTSLIYDMPNVSMPTPIKNALLEAIKNYITSEYELEDRLYDIVAEALFTRGAYVEAIIPEASLDNVINDTNVVNLEVKQEHFKTKTAYANFKNTHKISRTKEFNLGEYINITQDFSVIKSLDNVIKEKTKEYRETNIRLKNGYYPKQEVNTEFIKEIFKQQHKFTEETEIVIPSYHDASRQSIGKPLVLRINTDAIIPVHTTTDKSTHIGYYLLVDENGLPITNIRNSLIGSELLDYSSANTSELDTVWNIGSMTFEPNKLREMEDMFGTLLEEQLIKRLKKGTYGDLVEIDRHNDIYKIMFFRALKAKRTQIVYLPEDIVSYFAYEYRSNGTGKSLIEKVSLLYSIKSNLFITRIISTIRNSITNKIINIKLSEDEPDPMGKIHEIFNTVINSTQSPFNWNLFNPLQIDKMARELGYIVKVDTGEYEIAPDITRESTDYVIPDQELDETITENILLSFGLTMDMVKTGYDPELATTYIGKNLLFCKRILPYITKTGVLVTKHISKIIKNDTNLRNNIGNVVSKNIKELKKIIIERYKKINNIEEDIEYNIEDDDIKEHIIKLVEDELNVTLPTPQLVDANAEINALKYHIEKVTDILDTGVPDDVFDTELFGEIGNAGSKIKAIMKAGLILNYIRDNNILPTFNKLIAEDFNKENNIYSELFNMVGNMLNNYKAGIGELIKINKKVNKGYQEKLDKLQNNEDDHNQDDNQDSGDNPTDTGGNEGGEGEGNEGMEDAGVEGSSTGGMDEGMDDKDPESMNESNIDQPDDISEKIDKDEDGDSLDKDLNEVKFDTDDNESKNDKKEDKEKDNKKEDKKDDKKEDKKEEKPKDNKKEDKKEDKKDDKKDEKKEDKK